MADETTNQTTDVKDAAQAPAAAPELTIQDLNAIKSIIDVASQRGAFKPGEMMTVGQTYTRLENFLIAIQAQQQQPEGAKKGE
jgi:hypothetical protein